MFEGIFRDVVTYIVKVNSNLKLVELKCIIYDLYINNYLLENEYYNLMEINDSKEPEIMAFNKRKMFENLKSYLIGRKPESYYIDIYSKFLSQIKDYTFQGGIGYAFSTTGLDRDKIHHQCIMPEYYQNAIEIITDEVLISCLVLDKFIILSSFLSREIWGN